MEKYLPNFKNCLQKEVPFCQAQCPFHLDIHSFIEKMQRSSFNGAYKDYRNAVGFPSVVAALCPQYCNEVCPMENTVELKKLEQAAIDYAKRTDPPDYNLPKKKGRIAIIGGGLSGLGCALRLSTKKYDVAIFEKSDSLGGTAIKGNDKTISSQLLNDEIKKQFQFEEYELHLNTEIKNIEDLKTFASFDAIYVATGKGGNDLGLLAEHLEYPCFMKEDTGIFAGGMLLGEDLMVSLADGLRMGTTIDNFLKTGNLIYSPPREETCCHIDDSKDLSVPAIESSGDNFTAEESAGEANRCIKCQCDGCRTFCDLTEFYNRWPVRIRDEIQATTLPGSSELKATPAKRLINTCTQCGLCKEVCPEDIDLGGLILEARKSMHKQEKMAPAYNEFFLRDMAFTNGPLAAITKLAPSDSGESEFAFFPGCQLGASDPQLVINSYEYLLKVEPSTGLILSCCGIPAEWAGDDQLLKEEILRMKESWGSLGQPTLILACPTCKRFINKYLPEIQTVFLYDVMAEAGVSIELNNDMGIGKRCVFDPCSTRDEKELRNNVRKLAESAGIDLEPLPNQERHSACCSYGGHNSIANPEFAKQVIEKRTGEKDYPYIAYCINCRDSFLSQGKDTMHILDIIFNRKPYLTTATARRENRIILKEQLLKQFWSEDMKAEKRKFDFRLNIAGDVKTKLDKEHILEEDMADVVEFCLRTKRFVKDSQGICSGYRQIGHSTFWVEFSIDEMQNDKATVITLVNGYSHRMEIELEEVWNGHKIEIDL